MALASIIVQAKSNPETVDWKTLSSFEISDNDFYNFVYLVSNNQDKSWDWSEVIKKIPSYELENFINFDVVKSNPEINWDWYSLTKKFFNWIPYEVFNETKHFKWDWETISEKITQLHHIKNIKKIIDCPLNWTIISENINCIIRKRVFFTDDIPSGHFSTDEFDEFMNYLDFPWVWSIIYKDLPKEKIEKINSKRYELYGC